MADVTLKTTPAPSVANKTIILKKPVQLQNIDPTETGSPFVDSIWPYAELYEFGTGIVRAATDNVLDFTLKWVIDAAGSVSCTFSAADSGLLNAVNGKATLPFSDTLLGSTTPLLRGATGAPFDGSINVFGTPYQSTIFGTPSMDLQLRFSLGGGDFIDAKKMVLNTETTVENGEPLIIEAGNSLWEQYGKVVIPHFSAEGIRFIDFVFADPGTIQSYNAIITAPTSGSSSFLTSIQNSSSLSPNVVPGLGYLSKDNTLPFIGGVFKIYCPVNFTGLLTAVPTTGVIINPVPNMASFIYLPLINNNLSELPMSVDIQAGTFTKMLEAVIGKAAAIVATPYVAHYVEDSSDLYTQLTKAAYPELNTEETNTLLLGQIFKSDLTFISANTKENKIPILNTKAPNIGDPLVITDSEDFAITIERFDFSDNTLGTVDDFNPVTTARIDKGIAITPDYSATWDSAYFIGGSTDCDFPQNGRVTCIRIINDKNATGGNELWATNIPLVGVYVTDIVGGVYVQMGNQIFTPVSPNFGVYDIQIDPHNNDVYVATGSGVYVCRGFSLLGSNKWNNLGGWNAPIKKIQLNVGVGTTTQIGNYIVNPRRIFPSISVTDPVTHVTTTTTPTTGPIVYALALGTASSTIGVYSFPVNNPDGIDVKTGIINKKLSETTGHPGWDNICYDQTILSFAVLQDSTVFWANSQNVGILQSHNFTHPFQDNASNSSLQYDLTGGDGLAGVANGVTIDHGSSEDTVIANSIIAVQQYPTDPTGTITEDFILIITNGVTAQIYTIILETGDPIILQKAISGDGGLSLANGGLAIDLNYIQVLPAGTKINGEIVYALAATDQGLYAALNPPPFFGPTAFKAINGQSGLDAENLLAVAVGTPFSDIHIFGNSGYSLPCVYTPMWTAGDNTFFESMSGGNWWINRINDNITLASNFFKTYSQWVSNAQGIGGAFSSIPSVFRNSSLPPPVPARIIIPLTELPDTPTNISNYPQGPNYPDLSNVCWIRDRNERGEFYYYIGRTTTDANPRPISLLQKGQATSAVSSLAVDNDFITTDLCSDQLALVTKKWFIENSIPPFKVVMESSFASRFAGLRFLRPMHIVHVFFNEVLYTEDGNPHVFMALDNDFYVLDHTIKYGGDSKPYAITETTLSSEMQNSRLTPDDLAADLQEIVKNLQLRG